MTCGPLKRSHARAAPVLRQRRDQAAHRAHVERAAVGAALVGRCRAVLGAELVQQLRHALRGEAKVLVPQLHPPARPRRALSRPPPDTAAGDPW